MKRAKAVFMLPGVVRCTAWIYLNSKRQFSVNLLNLRDPHNGPRIAFKGFPMPDGSARFHAGGPGFQDSFVVAKDWKGGVYTCGDTHEQLLFSLRVEPWEAAVFSPGDFFKIVEDGRMIIVRAKNREKAQAWGAANGFGERAFVSGASWPDVEVFKSQGGEVQVVGAAPR